jgi:hypothetical protein
VKGLSCNNLFCSLFYLFIFILHDSAASAAAAESTWESKVGFIGPTIFNKTETTTTTTNSTDDAAKSDGES